MVRKKCNSIGCMEYVNYKVPYCEKHEGLKTERFKLYDNMQRDEKTIKFYNSSKWRKLRKAVLAEQPLCIKCLNEGKVEAAKAVDHIIELKDDWNRRFEISNLQPLCHKCHTVKTVEEKRKRIAKEKADQRKQALKDLKELDNGETDNITDQTKADVVTVYDD